MYYLELHHKNAETVEFENREEFEELVYALAEAEVPFNAYEDCPECDGEGGGDYLTDCGRSASYCCGGCYAYGKCDPCNGEGKIDFE